MSACELYRVISPFSHLKEQGYHVGWVEHDRVSRVNLLDWDVYVLPRTSVEGQAERDRFFRTVRELGKVVVYETDDDFFNIPPWNPVTVRIVCRGSGQFWPNCLSG